ncbi:MAG: translation initiation factor IF-2 [Gemmatimonadota bacterium]
MRVLELANDLNVSTDVVVDLLRGMGIPVADARAQVPEADVARVLARVERERRSGKKDAREAVLAAKEDVQTPTRRRRRRAEPAAPEETVEAVAEDAAVSPPEGEDSAELPETDQVPVAEQTDAGADADAPDESRVTVEEAPPLEEDAIPVAASQPMDEAEVTPVEEITPDPDAVATPSAQETGDAAPARRPLESARAKDPKRKEGEDAPVRKVRKLKPTPAASAGPGGQVRIQAEGFTADGQRKKDKKKGKKRARVDQDAVQDNIQRVMAELKGGGKKRKRTRSVQPSKEEREAQEEQVRVDQEQERKTVRVNEFLTVAELAELMDVSSTAIIGSAFKNLGLMVTINQRLDFDQIELLLDEFGFTAVREEEYGTETPAEFEEEDDPESKLPRPPVVTVMGHVDHGKTLLLDSIRKTNVVAGESGGITQHIGAYHVELDDGRAISFLDTPGHAAFTAMRARGADITDIVILMVAADDSVMPQTKEAISHAKNAGVPLVVAVNKVDLPAANPGKVKQELLQHGVTVEDFGGEVLAAEISAKTGQGISDLLEKVLLQAEMLELRANPNRAAQGTVIESKLDVGKGPVATVLVQRGTLRVGDSFVVGHYDGRVRALLDERGKTVDQVGPGMPVQVLGSPGVPQSGDLFVVMSAERAAEIAGTRQRLDREKQLRIRERGIKLGDFSQLVSEGKVDSLNLIIKADVDGSVQAVSDALEQLSTDEVRVEVIHRGVGAVNESDVLLAETAGAVIVGFRVRPDTNARLLAEREDVDIHSYDVIYEAVDQIRAALEGMLSPEQRESILGSAEVRETFKVTKAGTVAGCHVVDGVIDRKATVRVVRDGILVYTGEIASLKRFKDDVKEVREGFECGISIANFNDVKVGDVLECFKVEEVARTLAGSSQGRS